jgi:hypothetical protein
MLVEINGKTYYRTAEICAKAGISRATLESMRAEAEMIKVEYSTKKSAS